MTFDTSEGNQLSYFQNGYFFKILWWFHQPHNHVRCRQKIRMFSEVFTKWTIALKIVTFLAGQSLSLLLLVKSKLSSFWHFGIEVYGKYLQMQTIFLDPSQLLLSQTLVLSTIPHNHTVKYMICTTELTKLKTWLMVSYNCAWQHCTSVSYVQALLRLRGSVTTRNSK